MNATELIAAMKTMVAAPGFRYLEAHKDDFYKHDVATLTDNFSPGVRYLWVVTRYGTHLTRIGVHPRANEWAYASIESGLASSSIGAAIYLLNDQGIKPLTREEAVAEVGRMDYTIEGNRIGSKRVEELASFEIATYRKPLDGNQYSKVALHTDCLRALTKADLTALRAIAICESEAAVQSLFVKVEAITLNGIDLSSQIDRLPSRRLWDMVFGRATVDAIALRPSPDTSTC